MTVDIINELCLEPISDTERCQLLARHLVPCSADPDGGFVPLPSDPWNEIVPRLWQGGSHTGPRYFDPVEGDFDSVLTLTPIAPFASAPVMERRFHFNDGQLIPGDLVSAVDWAYQQWALQKRHVLIRCQGGLNRSALVVALLLYRDGHDIADAIRVIRERRSPYALCNRWFVQYLEGLT